MEWPFPLLPPPVQIRPGDRSTAPENIKLARDNKLPFFVNFPSPMLSLLKL
jgi:hypothetical protein